MPWAPVASIEIGEITRDVNLSVKVFLSSPTSLWTLLLPWLNLVQFGALCNTTVMSLRSRRLSTMTVLQLMNFGQLEDSEPVEPDHTLPYRVGKRGTDLSKFATGWALRLGYHIALHKCPSMVSSILSWISLSHRDRFLTWWTTSCWILSAQATVYAWLIDVRSPYTYIELSRRSDEMRYNI